MFLPISDSPNPPQRSYMTWSIIGLNIIVYCCITLPLLFQQVDLNNPHLLEYLRTLGVQGRVSAQQVLDHIAPYDLIVFRFGFRPAEFSLVSLFTALFLHGGFWHLAGNMLFLFIFGNNVEYRLGRLNFVLTYLGCGVIATLFFALFAQGSQVPLIGASGAIFGILGCYFLWFPKNRVRCFLFLFPFITTNIYLPSRLVLGFYLIIDNILPFLISGNAESGIAHGAHIGGFLGGVGLAWLMGRMSTSVRKGMSLEPPVPDNSAPIHQGDSSPMFEKAKSYLLLNDANARQMVSSSDVLSLGNFLLGEGKLNEALRLYKRFIVERPRDPQLALAYLGAGMALYRLPRQQNVAYQYFLNARELAEDEGLAEQARYYLRRIEGKKIN